MQIQIEAIRRESADDIDWSDLFDAEQTGPAAWVVGQPGLLEIPFDRALTADEVIAVQRRLESADAEEEALVADVDDFLAQADTFLQQPSPHAADAAIQQASVRAMRALVQVYRRRPSH